MTSRRDFLTGQSFRDALERAAEAQAENAAVEALALPAETIRLGTVAMASDFEVVMNPGPATQIEAASRALDLVNLLEEQLSVFRPHTELSRLNVRAADEPVAVERQLFELLARALRFAEETDGAYDPTAGPLVMLWRRCRKEKRLPGDIELAECRERVGWRFVELDHEHKTVRFQKRGIELNLNAMGKGYALDRAAGELSVGRISNPSCHDSTIAGEADTESEQVENPSHGGVDNWLMHGGYSSILARGRLAGYDGWPVAIRHPLFPQRQLGTWLLKDRAMSTSGSAVQFFRYQGRRYGHLIDPRTGWPVEQILAATVVAPTAADAEALSTAFFVMGVEKAREYCHNRTEVSALLIPSRRPGAPLEPVICGTPEANLTFAEHA
jgi:FAD:protein FMN transferase